MFLSSERGKKKKRNKRSGMRKPGANEWARMSGVCKQHIIKYLQVKDKTNKRSKRKRKKRTLEQTHASLRRWNTCDFLLSRVLHFGLMHFPYTNNAKFPSKIWYRLVGVPIAQIISDLQSRVTRHYFMQ